MGRAGWYQEYHPNYGKGSRVKEGVDQFCVVSGMGSERIDENYTDRDFNSIFKS